MHAVAPTMASSGAAALLEGISLEITSRDVAALPAAAEPIAPGTPISVTYLPGESEAQRLAAVRAVLDLGLRPVPHLSARRVADEAELERYLDALATMGASDDLFVVAGDLDTPMGPFEDALALIRSGLFTRFGAKSVGIGGYPEGHPKIADHKLWQALEDKAAAVADQGMALNIVTQFGFDAAAAGRWVREVRARGIAAPIRIGVPGPASAGTLIRFAARCGVAASASVLRKYGLSLTRLMQPAGPS